MIGFTEQGGEEINHAAPRWRRKADGFGQLDLILMKPFLHFCLHLSVYFVLGEYFVFCPTREYICPLRAGVHLRYAYFLHFVVF